MLFINVLFTAPQTPFEWVFLVAACAVGVAVLGWAAFATVKLVKDGKIGQLKEAIVKAIKEAEKTHGGSEEKLQYALTLIKSYCEEIGVKVNDQLIAWVVEYIKKYLIDHNELEEIEEQEGKN